MVKTEKTAQLIKLLNEKSRVKFQVYENTVKTFSRFKQIAKNIHNEIKHDVTTINKQMVCSFRDKGDFEAELKIASDLVLLTMHTNVFKFSRDHAIMKTSYVQEDNTRGYCGIIYIYNYLADSFKYNRLNDVGYLVGRVFINKESHFFVEGKRELGFLFNNFMGEPLDDQKIRSILESAIQYSVDFDALTPEFDRVKEVSVQEMMSYSKSLTIKTGKRLGFRFEADSD
jgi:hypothetical protein